MKNKNTVFTKVNLIVLLFCMTFVNAQNMDINMLRDINVDRNKDLDPTFKLVTNSAVPFSVATPIIIYSVGLIKKDSSIKKQAIFIGETFLVNAFITTALKHTMKRDRPFETYPDIDQATSAVESSFPSGHTSLAFATATSLSIAYPKWYVIAPSFVWAGAVGYSRMHLGVHYSSDVFAGAIIGSGSAYLSHKVNKWINKKRSKKGQVAHETM
ncbi:phosphatase PAP2 family protein [Flavobacterium rhamnosiphilum]|uniref:Phosphatase PAP2 family protein n=1 Tax=Flavobacterium rhamnosiphilum TaxID=2541724 RepID=A0A4V2Z9F8_9FLAO|nr:phosphatase PAP2 family protein [Flavobacterium rhamnosiphilum]TDE45018.1 phosphatase PAP2 family protein [Flavobacterium rhamnosiphilum]